jgi:amino acid adenylation domain-containing protein
MTRTFYDEFRERAIEDPDAIAVYTESGVLTYSALDQRVQEIAEQLAAAGAGPGVPVGICIERNPDLLAGLLAILRSGSCYLPLDPKYPAERLKFMVEDSGTRLLLTTTASSSASPAGLAAVVLGAKVTIEPSTAPDSGPVPVVPPDTAYLIFTSGSTGRPKGVAIRHSGAAAMLSEMDSVLAGCDRGVVAAASSVCFDMSVMEIFHALCRGSAVVLLESPVHLPENQHADKVTRLYVIPSVMNALLDAGELPPNLRTVVFGGESLRRKLVDRVYQETTAERVFNAYGPTEGTVFCTFGPVPREESEEPSIGTRSVSTRVYVLDENLEQVPAGEPGELYLAGAGLASGYVNRPGTTAERFVPDPFADGERMYRSGDIVKRTADGRFHFVGRKDHQVKVRGFRIELEEVEARLTGLPQVREAAVVVRGDRLIAYVVPHGESKDGVWLDPALRGVITGQLATELPEYMVPATVVFLAAVPLAANGKLDRSALPSPPAGATGPATAAGTATEVALTEIWGQLLDLDPAAIGVEDAFYELGGNSLLVVRMARILSRRFGRRVSVADLFRFRDIADLGRWLDEDDSDATPAVVDAARRRAIARRSTLRDRTASTRNRVSVSLPPQQEPCHDR